MPDADIPYEDTVINQTSDITGEAVSNYEAQNSVSLPRDGGGNFTGGNDGAITDNSPKTNVIGGDNSAGQPSGGASTGAGPTREYSTGEVVGAFFKGFVTGLALGQIMVRAPWTAPAIAFSALEGDHIPADRPPAEKPAWLKGDPKALAEFGGTIAGGGVGARSAGRRRITSPATVNGPAVRHYAHRVTQKTVAKKQNSVILRGVDVASDIKKIKLGKAKKQGTNYIVNKREYGLHSNGTLYPIKGEGIVQLNRPAFKALGVYNQFGNTTRAHGILNRMGVRSLDRISAIKVYEKNQ